jgi:hypothetical protein
LKFIDVPAFKEKEVPVLWSQSRSPKKPTSLAGAGAVIKFQLRLQTQEYLTKIFIYHETI